MTPASALSRLEKLAEAEADSSVPKYLPEYDPLGVVNFGWQGIVDEWMQAGKALLSLLSEPGEACGPRLMIQSSPLSADKEEYVPLTELLQARAAHELELADIQRDGEQMIAQISTAMQKVVIERDAERAALASSEARVRILSDALEKIAELQGSPIKSSAGWAGQVARQALLEVQR